MVKEGSEAGIRGSERLGLRRVEGSEKGGPISARHPVSSRAFGLARESRRARRGGTVHGRISCARRRQVSACGARTAANRGRVIKSKTYSELGTSGTIIAAALARLQSSS